MCVYMCVCVCAMCVCVCAMCVCVYNTYYTISSEQKDYSLFIDQYQSLGVPDPNSTWDYNDIKNFTDIFCMRGIG